MAYAYHHHGKWFACWKDGRGRWRRTATLARTKTDAKRLAVELEAKGERQRKGLEPLPDEDGGGTVAELLSWWLAGRVRRLASKAAIETMTRAHLLTSEFADAPLASLTPGEIETFLIKKGAEPPAGAGLAPQTVNHLRGFLYRAFEQAKKVGRYTGTNPVASVPKVKVPKRTPDYLRHEEVEPVLAALLERGSASVACGWTPLFATAIYAGLRKGELAALKKTDIDLKAGILTVRRSWERDRTKGGDDRHVPINKELVPFLQAAMSASPSELLFPRPDGAMLPRDIALQDVLRRALGRAGIVSGYLHKCRSCGYPSTLVAKTASMPSGVTRRSADRIPALLMSTSSRGVINRTCAAHARMDRWLDVSH